MLRAAGLALVVCTGGSTVAQRVRGLRLGPTTGSPSRATGGGHRPRRGGRPPPAPVEAALTSAPVQAGEVEIRADQYQAFVGDRSIDLTRREFELIELLSKAEGRVLEREEIYERVWGYAMARGDRSVDVFVRKLRQKLETASPGWRYIHTHFGVGYRFAPEPSEPVVAELADVEPAADAPAELAVAQ